MNDDIKVWGAEDVQAQYVLRRAKHIRYGATCIWCNQWVEDGREDSGRKDGEPDWNVEGDFGCDMSPDTTENGVGSHNVSTDPEIWVAGKTVEK